MKICPISNSEVLLALVGEDPDYSDLHSDLFNVTELFKEESVLVSSKILSLNSQLEKNSNTRKTTKEDKSQNLAEKNLQIVNQIHEISRLRLEIEDLRRELDEQQRKNEEKDQKIKAEFSRFEEEKVFYKRRFILCLAQLKNARVSTKMFLKKNQGDCAILELASNEDSFHGEQLTKLKNKIKRLEKKNMSLKNEINELKDFQNKKIGIIELLELKNKTIELEKNTLKKKLSFKNFRIKDIKSRSVSLKKFLEKKCQRW